MLVTGYRITVMFLYGDKRTFWVVKPTKKEALAFTKQHLMENYSRKEGVVDIMIKKAVARRCEWELNPLQGSSLSFVKNYKDRDITKWLAANNKET